VTDWLSLIPSSICGLRLGPRRILTEKDYENKPRSLKEAREQIRQAKENEKNERNEREKSDPDAK